MTLVLSHFSSVWLFVTPWTVACQAPLSMGFSRKRYSYHFLLQGIFPTHRSNPRLLCLLHCRRILYHWATQEAAVMCISSQLLWKYLHLGHWQMLLLQPQNSVVTHLPAHHRFHRVLLSGLDPKPGEDYFCGHQFIKIH